MDEGTRQAALADVEGDIARLEGELGELRRLRAYLSREPLALCAPASTTHPPVHPGAHGSPARPSSRWANLAERALREAGPSATLRAREIADTLVKRFGVTPREGRILERKVYTVMSRRPAQFVNAGKGRWTLAEFRPDLVGVAVDDEAGDDASDIEEASDTEQVTP